MRCPTCQGGGVIQTDGAPLPCPDCHCGFQHCCGGERAEPMAYVDADGHLTLRADEAVAVSHGDGTVEVIERWQ